MSIKAVVNAIKAIKELTIKSDTKAISCAKNMTCLLLMNSMKALRRSIRHPVKVGTKMNNTRKEHLGKANCNSTLTES